MNNGTEQRKSRKQSMTDIRSINEHDESTRTLRPILPKPAVTAVRLELDPLSSAGAGGQPTYVKIKGGEGQEQKVYRVVKAPSRAAAAAGSSKKTKTADSPGTRTSKIQMGLQHYLQKLGASIPQQGQQMRLKTFSVNKEQNNTLNSTPLLPVVKTHTISIQDAQKLLENAIVEKTKQGSNLDGRIEYVKSSFFPVKDGIVPNCHGQEILEDINRDMGRSLEMKSDNGYHLLPEMLQREITEMKMKYAVTVSVKRIEPWESFELGIQLIAKPFQGVPLLRIGVTGDYPAEILNVLGIGIEARDAPLSSLEHKIGAELRPKLAILPDHQFRVKNVVLEWIDAVKSITGIRI